MKLPAALIAITGLTIAPAFADTYDFDKEHTYITFYVSHVGFSHMLGLMTSYDGSFTFDEAHPEKSKVSVTLKPAGIRTTSELLDHVLQGESFFNSDRFPDIRFESTGIAVKGDKSGDINGNLTMLGVTKPLTLHVHFNRAGYHPLTQMYIAGFSADTELKRSDFGMDYLIPMVGDDVRIAIETEGINMDRNKAESLRH